MKEKQETGELTEPCQRDREAQPKIQDWPHVGVSACSQNSIKIKVGFCF